MKHVMFDLETWGTRPGCALRSIGAVFFDPDSDRIGQEFYANIVDAQPLSLNTEESTVEWWRQQPAEAHAAFLSPEPRSLSEVASEFHGFFRCGAEQIWCHGATFDEPVWRVAAHSVGLVVPWKYWNVRDTRTLYAIAGFDPKTGPQASIKHHALEDAKAQARCVQVAMQMLASKHAA